MFGSSKPVVFDPYGSRRSRRRVPRWLLLLLGGVVLGAGGVVYVQERHLPPRLSAAASEQLTSSYQRVSQERTQLSGELSKTTARLQQSEAQAQMLADELSANKQSTERLRADLASLVALLPPDPRGGAVQVRAARFSFEGRQLAYDVVLSRDRAGNKPLTAVLQLVVAGGTAKGPAATVAVKPIPIAVGSHESVRGEVDLPEGFLPRETTVKVMDRPDGKLLGMRVLLVTADR